MFLYFDNTGTLKEIVSQRNFRNGDSVIDKIYIYIEDQPYVTSGWIKYELPNGTTTTETQFFNVISNNELVGKELPSEPVRNLKYFNYNHTYEEDGVTHVGYKFYEITVPDEVLNSSLESDANNAYTPTQSNLVVARVRFLAINLSVIMTLGAITFAVENNIGILNDAQITETQYNYLLKSIVNYDDDIYALQQGKVAKSGDTMTGDLNFASSNANFTNGNINITNGNSSITNGKYSSTNGVVTSSMESAVVGVIKEGVSNLFSKMTYGGLDVSLATGDRTHYGANVIQNRVSSTTYTLTLPTKTGTFALVSDITALDTDLQGQIDAANENHVARIDVVSTLNTATSVRFTIMATNVDNEERSSFDLTIGEATSLAAGLLTPTDKAKINAIANDIATALSTAKTYTDNKVARTNLVSVIGEATQSINGLLSSEDKRRLDTLYALLGETSDADSIVNTINEVLEIFDQYPEGADLVNALAAKVNITDIVDNLTSTATNKPLSANQGKVLKDLIDTNQTNIVNGTTIVGKANKDSDGNVIKDTYLPRDDAFALGFIEAGAVDSVPEELAFDENGNITNANWTGNVAVNYLTPPITDITISEVPDVLTFDPTQDYDNMITNANWTGIMTITY